MRGYQDTYTALPGEKPKHKGVFKQAMHYLWNPVPPSEPHWVKLKLRIQVIVSVVFLFAAKFVGLALPVLLKVIVNDLARDPPQFRWTLVLAYGFVRFASTFFTSLQDITFAGVTSQMERTSALELFEHLQQLSLSFHVNRQTGSVLRSVSRGASSFGAVVRVAFFSLFPVIVQIFLVCGFLFVQYSWQFALLTFGVMIVYFAYTLITTEWRNKFRRDMNEKDNTFNQRATDALLNFETVKYSNAEDHEIRRYDSALRSYQQANTISLQTLAILNSGQNLIISCGIAGAMFLAARLVEKPGSSMRVGDFVLIQQFILTLYTPLGFLGSNYRMLKQSIVDIESMIKLLNEPVTIKNDPDAYELPPGQGKVAFEHVSFRYSTSDRSILDNVSFTVEPGTSVAIVGASGAGKSTLGKLLYRFYDVDGGRITVDGHDIRHVTQSSLRSGIGIVPQDCILFNDTIGYNIGYGIVGRRLEGATQAEIEEAARAASIDSFIAALPEQYDTKVGERGLRLSGGERQRIAIARAILKEPQILLCDEATASLDSKTESEIQASLQAASAGRTSITIAHRLSTIVHCDSIIVLREGKIAEQGSHTALLELQGEYAALWEHQNRISELEQSLTKLKAAGQ